LSPERRSSRSGLHLIVESDLHQSIDGRTTVDRNEVLLVGRLSAAVEEHPLPSGDTVTKWRIIVRRRRPHRRGGTLTDSVPCVTFNRETAAVLRGLKPRDYIEATGSFRCRVFGPAGAKIWKYEVEVSTVKPVDATALAEPEGDHPTVEPEGSGHAAEPEEDRSAVEREDSRPAAERDGDQPAATVAELVPRQATYLAQAS
jgi:single-stranded DNA-binding protein